MQIKINDFNLTPTIRGFVAVSDFRINGSGVIQPGTGLRKGYVEFFDRKNEQTNATFNTYHEHDTVEEAQLWALEIRKLSPKKGLVEFTIQAGERTYRRWIKGAAIPNIASVHRGLITTHSIPILGGEILDKKPSTTA